MILQGLWAAWFENYSWPLNNAGLRGAHSARSWPSTYSLQSAKIRPSEPQDFRQDLTHSVPWFSQLETALQTAYHTRLISTSHSDTEENLKTIWWAWKERNDYCLPPTSYWTPWLTVSFPGVSQLAGGRGWSEFMSLIPTHHSKCNLSHLAPLMLKNSIFFPSE